MKHRNLTLSIVTALGLGLAGSGIAGSGYGHSASGSGSESAASSSSYSIESQQESSSYATSEPLASASEQSSSYESLDSSRSAAASESEVPVEVSDPSLVFSDGQWYSYSDGAWYALDEGEWAILAESEPGELEAMAASGTATDPYGYEYNWYMTEAPYYEITLYSTDGLDWYSADGSHVVSWTPVDLAEAESWWSPTASLSDASSGSYYLR